MEDLERMKLDFMQGFNLVDSFHPKNSEKNYQNVGQSPFKFSNKHFFKPSVTKELLHSPAKSEQNASKDNREKNPLKNDLREKKSELYSTRYH